MSQPQTFTFDTEREMAEAEAEAYAGFCKQRHFDPAQPDTRQAWIVYCDAVDEHPGVDPDEDTFPDDDGYFPRDDDY